MATTTAIAFAFVAICATASADSNTITSAPITNWGVWGNMDLCPRGRYAEAFQLKTEANQFRGDDTALNGIRIFCGNPENPDTAIITSSKGPWGTWGKMFSCRPNLISGFQLRVEPYQGNSDDTATNNVRFYCGSTDSNDYVEGDGTSWGSWGEVQFCRKDQAVCGIQTQVEPDLGAGDDTALNGVALKCCDLPQSSFKAATKD